jgi:iron complex outermembrane recepter protein
MRKRLWWGTSALMVAVAGAGPARSQTVLPEIVVTAPSPIVRRAPPLAPPASPPATAERAPAPAPPPPEVPLPGTLPIVTDQFATVTVVPQEELRRSTGATLGDLLFAKPGITGSSFAPGASSRPIIRGLDVNRVGVMENGVGGGGVSDLGEDHFVPINPLVTNQVEVIRGPATLRYGSQSIGGVVSATNNRIPDALPACREYSALRAYAQFPVKAAAPSLDPTTCANFELRTAATSVDRGLEGGALLDAAVGSFAIHADAFGRTASDYRIPSYPYRFEPGRPFNGTQPNSFARTDGQSVGGSYVFEQGFVGLAVTQNNALYGIPGIDGEDHRTRIDARETKVTGKGEWRPQSSAVDAIRFWLAHTSYKHNELGLADPADPTSDGIRQTFTNREQEGRVEMQLLPFDLRFASLTTALGVQAGHQQLTAPGDTPGPLSGLYDPNSNTRVAAYIFNQLKFSDALKAQVAGRIENVNLNGSVPDILAGDLTPAPRDLTFTPKSVSFGVIRNLPWDLVGSVTAQRVERAPKPAELFSRGPHDATATFDIGNPNLKIETAESIEVGLRQAKGPFRFEATAYYTRFKGFIFRNLTGETCDETPDTCTGAPFFGAGGELNQALYSQRDAIFRGGEFQSQLDVAPLGSGMFGIESQFDVVRATFTDGTNVPRIPPVRLGGGAFWRDANWLARVNLLHAFPQNDIAVVAETPTAGYTLLKAELSYTKKLRRPVVGPPQEMTIGVSGNNLLNEDIRNHVSYTKDEVLMPGRSVRVFANAKF